MLYPAAMDITIVKLGGSLIEAPELRRWLAELAAARRHLVVPGGGPFADAVRRAQAAIGFDDLAAHRMAILAMQQYGLLMGSLEPRLRLAETEAEMTADGRSAIWLPWRMIGRDESTQASWDVSSDSLALILATRLRARRLVLVKSGNEGAPDLVDAAFARLRPSYAGELRVLHRSQALPPTAPEPM
jgi:aspartokinase-like uncharacterized kinase